jgi:hypothetical protein
MQSSFAPDLFRLTTVSIRPLGRFARLLVLFVPYFFLSACVTHHMAQISKLERSDSGFSILLLPIDVELTEVSTGGEETVRADWTLAARDNLSSALKEKLRELQANTTLFIPPPEGSPEYNDINNLHSLHGAVGQAVQLHLFTPGHELPSKNGRLDWSLGPRASLLRDRYKTDYALFVHVRDSYASGGRVVYGVAVALLFGVAVPMGTQSGFASLVDLRTGDVVWYNRLRREGGDLRTLAPTLESVGMLLAGMPK